MLVYGPSEFIVQFPRKERHENRRNTDDNGDRNKKSLDFTPDTVLNPRWLMSGQIPNGFLNFVDLHGAVNKQPDIANAESNDLDCIFHA